VLERGGFDVFLVAAGDLPGVAVGVEVLQVVADGGVGGADCGVVGVVGFGDVGWEGLVEGAEAEGSVSSWLMFCGDEVVVNFATSVWAVFTVGV
jgi:hypothetical protein